MSKIQKDQYDIIDIDHSKLWRQRRKVFEKEEVIGFDTETIKGTSILLCDSTGRTLLLGSFIDHLKFLTDDKLLKTINVFYNLDYDFRAIFKMLPEEEFIFLIKNGELKIDFGNKVLIITYRPHKNLVLKIVNPNNKKDKKEFYFWDTAQYTQFKPLEDIGKKIGFKKIDLKKRFNIDVSRLNIRKIKNDKKYREGLIKYCIKDCQVAAKSHELYYHSLYDFGITTNRFYSGATAGKFLLQSKIDPPNRTHGKIFTLDDNGIRPEIKNNEDYIFLPYPEGLNKVGFLSYFGGRFETFLKGKFDNIYEYDINSAYPYIIKDLISLDGPIVDTTNEEEYNNDCIHAVIHCDLDIPTDLKISPYLKQIKGKTYYPVGYLTDCYIIKDEYEHFKKKGYISKVHKIKMMLSHPEGDYKPFKYVQELYDTRRKYKDEGNDSMQQAIKIVLNSIYGIMININVGLELDWDTLFNPDIDEEFTIIGNHGAVVTKHYTAGNVFMPIWAAEITARVRLMLLNYVEGQEDKVISFATDGIKTHTLLDNKEIDDITLGGWGFKAYGWGFVLGNGILYLSDSKTEPTRRRPTNKFRGFTTKKSILGLINDNLNKSSIMIEKTGPITSKMCTMKREITVLENGKTSQKKLSPEDTNIFLTSLKSLSCHNTDDNRVWLDEFKTFGEVLEKIIESEPYTYEDLIKKFKLL